MMRNVVMTGLSLAAIGSFAGACRADVPQPLLRLAFGDGLVNTGVLGGMAQTEEYAPNQGPVLGPSQRGTCLHQLRASRPGGPGRTPAGGSVVFPGEGLNDLEEVTLVVWFRPEGTNRIARVMYFSNQWDIFVSGSRIGFNSRHDGKDQHRSSPKDSSLVKDRQWNAVAITHDRSQGTAMLYHALLGGTVREVTEWSGIPVPDSGTGPVQIGNLEQIRPFRGAIDNVQVYDKVLTTKQISTLLQSEGRKAATLDQSAGGMPALPVHFAHGDVLLSTRSKRKNSPETIRSFRPDRIMWCYSHDPAYIADCRAEGIESFQSAINSIAGTTEPEAQALDLDGNPVVAPWMVAFNREKPWYWGCNNRPRFLEHSVERATKALKAGADWIQFDDWSMIVHAHSWGGACFCDDCMVAFRDYLSGEIPEGELQGMGITDVESFDYLAFLKRQHGIGDAATYKAKRGGLVTTAVFERFQRLSVRRFFKELRRRLDAVRGGVVPLSLNATFYHPSQKSNYMADIVDFLQGETWHMGLVDLAIPAKTAEAIGTWQVFVPKPRELRTARRAIAASYALGQLMLIPWDMYMGSDATGIRPRYYGTPEQYGDLFAFAKDNGTLLDGFETCSWAAVLVDLDNYDKNRTRSICERLFKAQIPFRFVPVGASFYPIALDFAALENAQVVVVACSREHLSVPCLEALRDLAETAPVFSDSELAAGDLEAYSPLAVWGPEGIVLLPRAPRDPEGAKLALHVLNRTSLAQVSWPSVLIRKPGLGRPIAKAVWHAPGRDPTDLQIEEHVEGTRLIIPSLGIWGIVELTLE
ncbi:MAG: LamG domain-containing protein [Lentisphaerae bacterium]|jgi:hypothetical protein|nr:LamG domain-containing protein [Lentisphaerota bacterium]MBT4818563.1 LamG domain-containing protein [Lentisphaerota bacterium]MBT5610774.1 LamG domain-containing protein [Lentisphaerota bacterium]MBT7060856.1 LamG domain-containing protein [Lentisphaerota bacterium]MBT7841255.1 LamG domain-containing protein [Lentisphaerota bacterium]